MDFRSLITFKTISAFPQTYLKTHAIRNKLNSKGFKDFKWLSQLKISPKVIGINLKNTYRGLKGPASHIT